MKKRKHRSIKRSIIVCLGIVFLYFCLASFSFLSRQETNDEIAGETVRNGQEAKTGNRIALIIDDIGHDLSMVNKIIGMNIPVTLSILPYCPYSIDAANKAKKDGLEVILHLPMEPYEYPEKDPGEGALFTWMSKGEILDVLEENIEAVPYIVGANNHMGSRFMENEDKLKIIFNELKKRNLFFVDSYTTNNSMGRRVAKNTGIRYAPRNVFIDNNNRYRDTLEILNNLIKNRDQWQALILIGHPYENTVRAIMKITPLLKSEGIGIVPLSTLVK